MERTALRVAGVCGALAVVVGAFGAHGLKARLAATGYAAQYDTAVLYHLVHTAALGMCALPGLSPRARRVALWSFVAGVVLFSGSLYVLALTGTKWLGAVTPFGGTAFIVGWVALAVGAQSGGRTASP